MFRVNALLARQLVSYCCRVFQQPSAQGPVIIYRWEGGSVDFSYVDKMYLITPSPLWLFTMLMSLHPR